ncbi:MAG: exodeoxyribonuclease VII small subunit [Bacilli bacterium]|nr:exodeoxyribonuclease VII small subunit [Bacilli bacterium]
MASEEKKQSFEEKLNRLNQIVAKIEGEVLSLEETMALYAEGKELIASLDTELKAAEEKVKQTQQQ